MQEANSEIARNSCRRGGAQVLQFPSMAQRSNDVDNLPNRVRYWRLDRGMTLKQAAGQLGMAFGHLQRIETGARELSTAWMKRIAEVLGVLPADLLNVEDGGLDPRERLIVDTRRSIPEPHRHTLDAVAEAQQAFRGAPEVVALNPVEDAERQSA